MLRIMLVDNHLERSAPLKQSLTDTGHDVIAHLTDLANLDNAVRKMQPDVVIIDTDSPSRDTLEHIIVMTQNAPRPVVMFTHDGDTEKMRLATRAGVSAYVVGTLPKERLKVSGNPGEAERASTADVIVPTGSRPSACCTSKL